MNEPQAQRITSLFLGLCLLAACGGENGVTVVIEDPLGVAAGADQLTFGRGPTSSFAERNIEGRAFPMTAMVAGRGESSAKLWVTALIGDRPVARGVASIVFDDALARQKLTLGRACSDDAACDNDRWCDGAETCISGLCHEGRPPCARSQTNCFDLSCVEESRACQVSLVPTFEDDSECTTALCTEEGPVQVPNPAMEGEFCSASLSDVVFGGLCVAGRCAPSCRFGLVGEDPCETVRCEGDFAYSIDSPLADGDPCIIPESTEPGVCRGRVCFSERWAPIGGQNVYADNVKLSESGRYIVFSTTSACVEEDTNFTSDVFLFDRLTGFAERISVGADGLQLNERSDQSAVSADGRYVAFHSEAPVTPDDTNQIGDFFLVDRTRSTVARISVGSGGAQGERPSLIRQQYFAEHDLSMSTDGNRIAFVHDSPNLVEDDTNDAPDVFVRDVALGTTTRVSLDVDGSQLGVGESPVISGNGRWVYFFGRRSMEATSRWLVRDLLNGSTQSIADRDLGIRGRIAVSHDGQRFAFVSASAIGELAPADLDGNGDVFCYDRSSNDLRLVSAGPDGRALEEGASDPSISPDGRFVAFASQTLAWPGGTLNLSDVFVGDTYTGQVDRVAPISGPSGRISRSSPILPSDQRWLVFSVWSDASFVGAAFGATGYSE